MKNVIESYQTSLWRLAMRIAEHDFRFTDTHHIKANGWQEFVASGQPPKRKSERDLYVGHVLVEIVKHLLQLESRNYLMFLDVQKMAKASFFIINFN